MIRFLYLLIIFFTFVENSFAYLGPGMGGGIIAATIGVIVAVLAAIFGVIWFPIKRYFKKKKK